MCKKCENTDCILSVDVDYNGQKYFSNLRFDLDDNRHEFDIEIGVYDCKTNTNIRSHWSESLQIKYCPFCGKELRG